MKYPTLQAFKIVFATWSLFTPLFSVETASVLRLTEISWGPEQTLGPRLMFAPHRTYTGSVNHGMEATAVRGSWEWMEDGLCVYREDGSVWLRLGHFVEDPQGLRFTRGLRFGDLTLWDLNSEQMPGVPLTRFTFAAETMGAKSARVTTDAKYRTGPGTTFEPVLYPGSKSVPGGGMPEPEDKPWIPEGVRVTVLAKTVKPEVAGQWKNVWYLIEVKAEMDFATRQGWMFGDFLKFDPAK